MTKKATFNTAYICYFFSSTGEASGRPSSNYEDTLLMSGSKWVKCFVLSRMTRRYIHGYIRSESGLWHKYDGSKEWNEDLVKKSATLSEVKKRTSIKKYFLIKVFKDGSGTVQLSNYNAYRTYEHINNLAEVCVISTYNGYHIVHYVDAMLEIHSPVNRQFIEQCLKNKNPPKRIFVKISKIDKDVSKNLRERMGSISNKLMDIANRCSDAERLAGFFSETIEKLNKALNSELDRKPVNRITTKTVLNKQDIKEVLLEKQPLSLEF